MQRSPELIEFIETIRAALQGASAPAVETTDRVFARLDSPAQTTSVVARSTGEDNSALNFLTPALNTARASPRTAPVATTFAALAPSLTWLPRPGSEADADFHAGHLNCAIVGPGGVEGREDVLVGASLLAPNVRYPDHSHPPEEVYVVLSDSEWFTTATGWYRPGVGGVVHHQPGVLHAMRSGETPLLAVWCLPL